MRGWGDGGVVKWGGGRSNKNNKNNNNNNNNRQDVQGGASVLSRSRAKG